MSYSDTCLQLARHVIDWSFVTPVLTCGVLPTTIEGSQRFLDVAVLQQDRLFLSLGARPQDVRLFRAGGAPLDSFFRQQGEAFPWVHNGVLQEAVLGDLRWIDEEIARLRMILALWMSPDAHEGPRPEHTLMPFTSVRMLGQLFSAYSTFAGALLPVLSEDLNSGVSAFYDTDERRRRGLTPPDPHRFRLPVVRSARA